MSTHGSAHIARTRDTWERSYGLHLVILKSPCLALRNTLTCRKSMIILVSATALYINQPRPLTSQPIIYVLINPPRKSRVPTLPFAVHLNILNSQYSHHTPYQESRQEYYELDLTVLLTATTNHSSPLGRSAERLDVVNRSQSSTHSAVCPRPRHLCKGFTDSKGGFRDSEKAYPTHFTSSFIQPHKRAKEE
jgi:hypothetical protein